MFIGISLSIESVWMAVKDRPEVFNKSRSRSDGCLCSVNTLRFPRKTVGGDTGARHRLRIQILQMQLSPEHGQPADWKLTF